MEHHVDVFVVPNAGWCYDPSTGNSPIGNAKSFYNMKQFVKNCEVVKEFGINPSGGDDGLNLTTESVWIQIWVTDGENDNLTDHGDFPHCLPYEFLMGVKEGDTKTTIRHKDGWTEPETIVWHFRQLPYRYRNYGSFEDAVSFAHFECIRLKQVD